jgi:hypothetical protein
MCLWGRGDLKWSVASTGPKSCNTVIPDISIAKVIKALQQHEVSRAVCSQINKWERTHELSLKERLLVLRSSNYQCQRLIWYLHIVCSNLWSGLVAAIVTPARTFLKTHNLQANDNKLRFFISRLSMFRYLLLVQLFVLVASSSR